MEGRTEGYLKWQKQWWQELGRREGEKGGKESSQSFLFQAPGGQFICLKPSYLQYLSPRWLRGLDAEAGFPPSNDLTGLHKRPTSHRALPPVPAFPVSVCTPLDSPPVMWLS